MKLSTSIFAAAALLGAVVAAAAAVGSPSADSATPTLAAPPQELALYGHVRALVRKGKAFELRFDPALWLHGVTANRAAIEDGVISPGDTVPNDYYVVDESRRLLTYRVPATARATVVTVAPGGLRSTRVTVGELAAILTGGNPKGRKLMSRRFGFWIRLVGDSVRSLDQQYQP